MMNSSVTEFAFTKKPKKKKKSIKKRSAAMKYQTEPDTNIMGKIYL
jgi:hypothetical protein